MSVICQRLIHFLFCLLLCVPVSSLLANSIETLDYITEQYAPYNYQDESGIPQGMAVEVLNKVWEVLDIPPQKIDIFPWARGYSLALNKKNTLLFSTTRSPSREDLFK